MLEIKRFVLGPVQTNCYIVANVDTKECVIIDPATCPRGFISDIKVGGFIPKAILLTHAHFDHIGGISRLLEVFEMPVYVQSADDKMLKNPTINMSSQTGFPSSYNRAICVDDGDKILIAGMDIQVIHTPGHTPGGCCYYIEKESVLFSGDTLFCQSVGRSDFPEGDGMQLVWSIQEKLMCLPENTKVYPGHMDETTIGFEKTHNPYI